MDSTFALDPDLIYLNHAMASPWPRRTVDAIHDFAHENLTQGALGVANYAAAEIEFKMRLRRILNADSVDDLAILKNTAEGVSTVAFGLPLTPGSNIVAFAGEYPSNMVAWQAQADRGVAYRTVALEPNGDPELDLMQACDENTRVIAVSSVQFRHGFRVNLERLGQFCRANDILFVIDAIQSVGCIPFDIHRYHADAVVGGVQKWLMAPEGIGWFWSSPKLRSLLRPTDIGWRSRENPIDFEASETTLASSARRFESGTISTLGIKAANASFSLVEETGIETIWAHISDRIDHLITGLTRIPGIEIVSDTRRERRSALLTFRSTRIDTEALFQHLSDNRVFCAKRAGGIRLSPHFHTPMAQLDQLLALIRQVSDQTR